MKKNQQKPILEKFTVTKLTNLASVYGGSGFEGGDGKTTETVPTKNDTIYTQYPTRTQG